MFPLAGFTGRKGWRTLGALAFAVGAVWWSTLTLQDWWREQAAAESDGPPGRPFRARTWEPEPPERRAPPVLAQAAFEKRQLAGSLIRPAALYSPTQVWTVHLKFTPEDWLTMEPRQIEPLDQRWGPNGEFLLRNPAASRNGLAGVRGVEFDWVEADVEFEDQVFPRAAVRYKGNGTFLRSMNSAKRPLKVDLDKHNRGSALAGRTTLNFANMVADDSFMHDVLAYELYRDSGVPAPRTAYARIWVTTNQPPARFLGLYALVEAIDREFAVERFGTPEGAIFKPVTHQLFTDLGDRWEDYDGIYDPKNKLTPAQSARVIEFSKFVSHASDDEFAAQVGEFIDLPAFSRFLAVTVLLSSYDGFLNNGQNFYVWLSPSPGQFHFLPWDLDNAWGKFGAAGSPQDRAEASIRHPWIGNHPLLERVFTVPAFTERYLQELDRLLGETFVPERLHRRIDELATLLRPWVTEEPEGRPSRFEQAVTRTQGFSDTDDSRGPGRRRSPHPLKWFVSERARSVRDQLDGRSEGVRLERWR